MPLFRYYCFWATLIYLHLFASAVEKIQHLFWRTGVIPEIFKIAPISTCQVTYPWGKLKPGAVLTPNDTKQQPKITWLIEKETLYSMFMTGMESPPKPRNTIEEDVGIKVNEWEQWFVFNIPGRDIDAGKCLFEYLPPYPASAPNKINYYSFLVFKQQYHILEYIDFDSKGYAHLEEMSVVKFVRRHNLGEPICGNLFALPYDEKTSVNSTRTTRPPLSVFYPGTFTYPTFNTKDIFTKVFTEFEDKHYYGDSSDIEKGLFLK